MNTGSITFNLAFLGLLSIVIQAKRIPCDSDKYSLQYIMLTSNYDVELRKYCGFDSLSNKKMNLSDNSFIESECLDLEFLSKYSIIKRDTTIFWQQNLIEIRGFKAGKKTSQIMIKNYWCNFYQITEFRYYKKKWLVEKSEIVEI